MLITVIDGQGAGLGRTFIKMIRKELGGNISIVGIGTNPVAAQNMLKSGADFVIYGDDQIVRFLTTNRPDIIVGPIGILIPGGINGEVFPKLAQMVFNIDCKKFIIPISAHGICIPGTQTLSVKEIFNEIINQIKAMSKNEDGIDRAFISPL